MKTSLERTGRCSYHLGGTETDLRAVRLTPDGGKEWQEVTLICGLCRKYLKGYFRYAKVKDVVDLNNLTWVRTK